MQKKASRALLCLPCDNFSHCLFFTRLFVRSLFLSVVSVLCLCCVCVVVSVLCILDVFFFCWCMGNWANRRSHLPIVVHLLYLHRYSLAEGLTPFSSQFTIGSSTACILSLCKITGTLRASNLGDSSFLLIRDKRCIYESPSQQHFWNCPYQLTIVPPGFRSSKSSKKSGSYVQDLPKDAVQSTHQLEDGDVIVLATDGFWDNVFTKETIELVDKELGDIIRDKSHHQAPSSKPFVPPFNHHPLPLQQLSQQLQSEGAQAALGEDGPEESERSPLTAEQVLARVRALSQRLTNTARHISLDPARHTPFSDSAKHLRSGG